MSLQDAHVLYVHSIIFAAVPRSLEHDLKRAPTDLQRVCCDAYLNICRPVAA